MILINLQGAILSGATISHVDLCRANLDGIIVDEKTDFSGSRFAFLSKFEANWTVGAYDLRKTRTYGSIMADWQIEKHLGVTHTSDTCSSFNTYGTPSSINPNCPITLKREKYNIKQPYYATLRD